MLVKLLVSRFCIVNGSQGVGDIIDVGDIEGNTLLERGQAEAVKPTIKRGAKKAETATRAKRVEKRG